MRVALAALVANKLRSVLTMLGIVIGVGAVIAMVALGNGAQQSVEARIAALGTNMLSIRAQRARALGVRTADIAPMTLDDVAAIKQRATLVTAVQPQQDTRFQVQYLNHNANTQVIGTSANYPEVQKYQISAGRMFTDAEDKGRRRVAVLGNSLLQELDVTAMEIVGQHVRIAGIQFEVVGVMAPKGQTGGFGDPDDEVLIPIETGRFRVFGRERLNDINVLVANESDISDAMIQLQSIMRRAHRIRAGDPDDFIIRNQADFLNTLGETSATFTYLLAGIAAVSLLVGGIGIMNIMLVSVTERTREIGVRKALGATRGNILLQFLIEAVVLCLLGGVVGVGFGVGGANALNILLGWSTAVAPSSILIAFLFSAAIGLIFGVWPARRAASLDPIQALRYE